MGNPQRSYIRVTMDIASQTTAGTNCKQYHFYYAWTGNYPAQYPDYQHIDEFTGVFAPISEMQEVAPETFLKWLERIGHDDAFLRVSYKLQKRMMKHTGQKPPWDPRKIKEIEEGRQRFMQRARELLGEEKLKTWEEKLYERWGIREIPPITPELLDQIVEKAQPSSRNASAKRNSNGTMRKDTSKSEAQKTATSSTSSRRKSMEPSRDG